MKSFSKSWFVLIVGVAALVAVVGVVVLARQSEPPSTPVMADDAPKPLRLSGAQFLLNWQSFPGREVLVEYCTLYAPSDKDPICVVFDGASRLGQIDLDKATFDPTSSAWANANCRGEAFTQRCSIRLQGTIRGTSRGRPVLYSARTMS